MDLHREVAAMALQMQEESQQMAAQVRDLTAEMEAIEETAESDDGLITATVGVRGKLVSLEIDPRVYRSPDSAKLATTIKGTIDSAGEQVEKKATEIARKMLLDPDDDFDPYVAPLLNRLDRRADGKDLPCLG